MEKNLTFIIDSGSDFEPFLANHLEYPVKVVPLYVLIDGKQYLDGVTISKSGYYKLLEQAGDLPKTSQPTPQDFYNIFKGEIEKGNKIFYIGLSSKLSGTLQSAEIAKQMFSEEQQEKIHLFNSMNVSVSIILLIIAANKLLKMGHSLKECIKKLEHLREKVKLFALLDTLENLRKGGRISYAMAKIGGILNIKPLITITDGLVESVEKFRGRKKGLEYINEYINNPENNIDKDLIFFAHNYTNEERLKEEIKLIDLSSFKEVLYLKIGTIIGTHTGTNTAGVVFQYKD